MCLSTFARSKRSTTVRKSTYTDMILLSPVDQVLDLYLIFPQTQIIGGVPKTGGSRDQNASNACLDPGSGFGDLEVWTDGSISSKLRQYGGDLSFPIKHTH